MSEEDNLLENLNSPGRKPRQLSLSELLGTEAEGQLSGEDATSTYNAALSSSAKKGRLKIFLGAAAGVGKTYAMLEEAQRLHQQGVEVVVGYVELHGRTETERLLEGLEVVPRQKVEYRGSSLEEMDTSAVIARHPQLVLVDELAHTNASYSDHEKRYEDIEEILDAGIDVYSTVNIQHLESLNDRVYELTGTKVRETFPDRILERADEVVLIDLPPEELRERLRQGKIYRPEKVEQALQNFFRTSNLMALRELALRETADAVESSGPYRQHKSLYEEEPPTANAFVLICVALKPQDARVIRQGWRFARRLNAPAEVVNVSREDERKISDENIVAPLRRLSRALNLPFKELKGDAVEAIGAEAKARRATLLVLGESTRNTWQEILFGSFTDRILRKLDGVDVYIVGDPSRRSTE
jgi:two-component system sensor histidine kinase KdpD